MSNSIETAPAAALPARPVPATLSPARRAWRRFRRQRLGWWSLCLLGALFVLSLASELVSNDRPLLVRYQGQWYVPVVQNLPETTFGGDFQTPTDYLDPYIRQQLARPGNWVLYAPNPYHHRTLNEFARAPNPAPPSDENLLGTDDRGRDVAARLLYGFRVSMLFALALTLSGTLLGVFTGALQGYFGGRTDLAMQRLIEIWSAMPELYLLIIFAAVFEPSVGLLLLLLSLFGWMGLSDYVRAEFLRNRQLDYVRAARALGLSHGAIIGRHLLPNSLTPVVTFLPFRMSAAILALTSLDFLGLGVPPGTPSLGELLAQGKNNIDAWWISLPTFGVLVLTLLLLTFMGDALRDALDPRLAPSDADADADADGIPQSPDAAPLADPAATVPDAADAAAAPALLRLRHLNVAFGAHHVVQDLSLTLRAGEKLALVGESGSGKSVTALSLLRLLPEARTSGSLQFDGRDLLGLSDAEMQALRGRDIAMVFQEPMTALNPLFTVGEQIAEVLLLKRGLDAAAARARTLQLLSDTGMPEPERRAGAYPHQLSGGQRQRAMIAMALAGEPRLLLADEPTTALDLTLRQQILDLLAELQRRHGLALLLITHDLPLVQRFADRVAVMQAGRLVEQGTVEQVFAAPRHAYTRRLLDSRPRRWVSDENDASDAQDAAAPPVLQARDLCVSYAQGAAPGAHWHALWQLLRGRAWRAPRFQAVRGLNLRLAPGRTLAVVGESGSGKSTLALAALGLLPFEGGLWVKGQAWSGRPGADRSLRRVVQVVFQDPFSSLSPRMTVEDIVGEGLRLHAPELDAAQRRARIVQALADVGLDAQAQPGLLARYPHAFSGGQRQRLALARALVVQPELLVLDEPTSALDLTIQQQILQLLHQLQRARGLAYLLITHDMDVVRAMAHEVLVMQDGQAVEQGPFQTVWQSPQSPVTQALVAAAG